MMRVVTQVIAGPAIGESFIDDSYSLQTHAARVEILRRKKESDPGRIRRGCRGTRFGGGEVSMGDPDSANISLYSAI